MNTLRTYIYIGVFALILGGVHGYAEGYVATSTNYILERDSLNSGGVLSTSTNYGLEDTAGEVGTGIGTSTNYRLYAGYQQMDPAYITISAPGDVTLLPDIDPAGGQSDGSATWTIETNNSLGYLLTIRSSTDPAMQASGGASFDNYTPASSPTPDYAWAVLSSAKEFGFTPEGVDITSTYKNDGASTCNTGVLDTASACWDSITVVAKTIASSASANDPLGTDTTVRFKAEAGSASAPTSGSYTAVVTLTATVQ